MKRQRYLLHNINSFWERKNKRTLTEKPTAYFFSVPTLFRKHFILKLRATT